MAFSVSLPIGSSGPSGSQVSGGLTPGVSASDFAKAAGGYVVNRYGPSVIGAAQTRLDSVVTKLNSAIAGTDSSSSSSGKSSSPSGGNNNGSSKGNNGSNNGGNSSGGRRASKSNGPSTGVGGSPNVLGVPQATIDSGILSGTINNPLQKTTKEYTPLFIQCGQLLPELSKQVDSTYAKLVGKELFYKYLIIVQSEVNFSLARNFTQESFYNYIEKISRSLQIYYMIDSILAFTSHSPNNNIAMTRLRMSITPDIANSHIKLREFLESTPIPPNLLKYIRHMYQNYSFSDIVGSSVVRLSFNDILCTSEYKGSLGITSATYSTILSELIDTSVVASILRKIRANWVVPMPPSSYEALYDPQFSTFWHNSDIAYEDFGSKTVKHTVTTNNNSELLYYGIFGNSLDGLIYASCSVATQYDVIEMGLWCPFTDFGSRNSINSSLLQLSNDDLIRPVTDIQFRFSSMVHAAPYTEITDANNPVWKLTKLSYAGACIPQVHSLENVTQAITRSINWLLCP